MVYITRRERFSAAHRLFREDWNDKKNNKFFGLCSNPNWHGHNYVLWVTIKGQLNPETGFVVNLKQLSNLIKEKIIHKLDHKNLNMEVDFLHGKIISTENVAIAIWDELLLDIEKMGVKLHRVKIQETENNFIEYYGN